MQHKCSTSAACACMLLSSQLRENVRRDRQTDRQTGGQTDTTRQTDRPQWAAAGPITHRERPATAHSYGGDGVDCGNPRLAAHFHAELDLTETSQPDLEAHADTTWNGDPDAYAVLIMRNRGAVAHGVWRMTLVCDASQLAEAVGSSKAAEKLTFFREMERGVGAVADVPAVLTTDSSSNWQVATRHASASRSRHALRRWRTLTQRILEGDLKLVHIDGASMPADFMTKKTDQKKVDYSVNFASNARNAVPPLKA